MVLKRAIACLFVLRSPLVYSSPRFRSQGSPHQLTQVRYARRKALAQTNNIFSNLGPTSTNAYNDTTGYYVLGPDELRWSA